MLCVQCRDFVTEAEETAFKSQQWLIYLGISFALFHGGVPVVAQWVTNLTSIHEDTGSIPGLAMWVQDLVSLWLCCRSASVALIQPLAWELPYATGVTKKKKQTNKKCTCHDWDGTETIF